MVGIYEKRNGLVLVAVAKDINSAKKHIWNESCEYKDIYTDPVAWFDKQKKLNAGAPRCYEFREVEMW